jgi:hypothetical protein
VRLLARDEENLTQRRKAAKKERDAGFGIRFFRVVKFFVAES